MIPRRNEPHTGELCWLPCQRLISRDQYHDGKNAGFSNSLALVCSTKLAPQEFPHRFHGSTVYTIEKVALPTLWLVNFRIFLRCQSLCLDALVEHLGRACNSACECIFFLEPPAPPSPARFLESLRCFGQSWQETAKPLA